jgi:hypothetical protein
MDRVLHATETNVSQNSSDTADTLTFTDRVFTFIDYLHVPGVHRRSKLGGGGSDTATPGRYIQRSGKMGGKIFSIKIFCVLNKPYIIEQIKRKFNI